MTSKKLINKLLEEDLKEKRDFIKNNPDFIPDADFWDAHSCSRYTNEFGLCQICGAIKYGSSLYKEIYGGE